MKRQIIIPLFLLFVLLAVTGAAQTFTDEGYAKEVAKASKETCPKELEGCIVDSFFYQSNYLHECLTLIDDYMLGRDIEGMKLYFADVFRYRFEISSLKDIYEKLLKMDGGFVIDITLDSSRRTFSLKYTPDEFKQIWADREKPEYQDSLTWLARHSVFTSLWFQNQYHCLDTVSEDKPIGIDTVWQSGDTVVIHSLVLDSAYTEEEKNRDTWVYYWKETFLFYDDHYLLEDMNVAGYHFLAVYENVARTDSFHVFLPHSELQRLVYQASRFTEATDDQVDTFMYEVFEKATKEDWEGTAEEESERYLSATVGYHDGFMEILLQIKENVLNFNMTPSEFTSFKNFFCTTIRHDLEASLETPYIMNDTVLVTLEDIYRHLKGFKILYIEENTHKALNIEISTDEIRNAKLLAIPADETTSNKIEEQLMIDKYAREVVQYSQELCPLVSGCNVVDSMVYDYHNLHYYSHLDPSCQLMGDTAHIKQEIMKQLKFGASETALFFDLAELNGGLLVHFRLPKVDSIVTIFITPQEMWSIVHGDTISESERARFALNAYIANINAQLPILLDYLTRIDSLSIENGNLIYHHSVLSQFDRLKKDRSLVEWSVRTRLLSGDSQVIYQILMCFRAGYGMCYRYVPAVPTTTGKKKVKKPKKSDVINICFSAEELGDMLN